MPVRASTADALASAVALLSRPAATPEVVWPLALLPPAEPGPARVQSPSSSRRFSASSASATVPGPSPATKRSGRSMRCGAAASPTSEPDSAATGHARSARHRWRMSAGGTLDGAHAMACAPSPAPVDPYLVLVRVAMTPWVNVETRVRATDPERACAQRPVRKSRRPFQTQRPLVGSVARRQPVLAAWPRTDRWTCAQTPRR